MKPIFIAIAELLKFQSSCTIPQIAKISGKKQMEVLVRFLDEHRLWILTNTGR